MPCFTPTSSFLHHQNLPALMLRQQHQICFSDQALSLSFRAAFVTTLDLLQAEFQQEARSETDRKGFLERLPLLQGCAIQVQLNCLLETWQRVRSGSKALTDLDACVSYCAIAELAHLATLEDNRRIQRAALGIPDPLKVDMLWLASNLRTLQITWPFDPDSITILRDGSFLDTNLDAVSEASLHSATASQMLDLAGQWFVTPELLKNTQGLATESEHSQLAQFFTKHSSLMNL